MDKYIKFSKKPYDRVFLVDLIDETDDMKWKVLDYHNQDFVLKSIVNGQPFTRDGHKKFLEILPSLKRKQYIVYFDHRAIGKLSWTPSDDGKVISDSGYFLFNEDDLMSGMGLIMAAVSFHYIFDVLNVEIIHTSALIGNKNSRNLGKRFGFKVVGKDEQCVFMDCTKEDYHRVYKSIDELLELYFSL